MKIFKKIYFPVLALLLVFFAVISFFDFSAFSAATLNSAKAESGAKEIYAMNGSVSAVSGYISDYLDAAGFKQVDGAQDEAPANRADERNRPVITEFVPTFFVQKTVADNADKKKMASAAGTDFYNTPDSELTNIVAYIPGTRQAGYGTEVLFINYDGVYASQAVNTMNALLTAEKLAGGEKAGNDIFIVFMQGGESGCLGAYAFERRVILGFEVKPAVGNTPAEVNTIFNGDMINLAVYFEPRGTAGATLMYNPTGGGALISAYAGVGGQAKSSSILSLFAHRISGKTAVEVLDKGDDEKYASLSFANISGRETARTALDTPDTLTSSFIKDNGNAMYAAVKAFSNGDITNLTEGGNAMYFNYLDFFTVAVSNIAVYILTVIIFALVAAVIVFNIRNKAFGWKDAGWGALAVVLTAASTAAVMFGVYYIVGLLGVGFGVIPLELISTVMYSNTGILIGFMLAAVALNVLFSAIFKRLLRIKVKDLIYGNTLLWALAAVVLSFAFPAGSYIFTSVAVLELVVLLAITLFKKMWDEKFPAAKMQTFMLPLIPLVITMPIIIPAYMLCALYGGAIMLPALVGIFSLFISFGAPYLTYLEPVLDRLVKKLPKRTVVVQRTVIEEVEVKNKAGKVISVSREEKKKLFNEKRALNYKNYFTSAVLGITAFILIACFGLIGFKPEMTVTAERLSALENHAMVYVLEASGGSVTSSYWKIADKNIYTYVSQTVDGFSWDEEKGAYVKTVQSKSTFGINVADTAQAVRKTGNSYSLENILTGASNEIYLSFSLSGVTTFTLSAGGEDILVLKDINGAFKVRVPENTGSFTFKFDRAVPTAIEVTECDYNSATLMTNSPDWKSLLAAGKTGALNANYTISYTVAMS